MRADLNIDVGHHVLRGGGDLLLLVLLRLCLFGLLICNDQIIDVVLVQIVDVIGHVQFDRVRDLLGKVDAG